MIINTEKCNKCRKCVAECPQKAIIENGGTYSIDPTLCDDCKGVFEIECIRFCDRNAITFDDGEAPAFDSMRRIRSEHLVWLIAILGSRGSDKFMQKHWTPFRELISAAYCDPELKVRLVKNLDDNCAGCVTKSVPGHLDECGRVDDACFERMELTPGTVIKLWDAVQIIEEKFSIEFIKELGTVSADAVNFFIRFVSHDAKALEAANSPELAKCTCPKTDCEWHGKCKECVALHNSGNDHIPACLHPVIRDKLNALASVIEMNLTGGKESG